MHVPMNRRRAGLWLIVGGFVALSGSAMSVSAGVLLLVLAALVVPLFAITVYLALQNTDAALATPHDHGVLVSTLPAQFPLAASGADVYAWENEGGRSEARTTKA